jgi:Mrp family chromosome partitioning ATPase
MHTSEEIREKVGAMLIPGSVQNLEQANLIRKVDIKEDQISIELSNAALAPEMQEFLKAQISANIEKFSGSGNIEIKFSAALPKDLNQVRNIIMVMSGKGGVGKSTVASLMAVALKKKGKSVGILDADITGPSIPRMFGVNERPAGSENGILPVFSKMGIEIISVNLFLPSEEEAVIWRGPLIGGAIRQFWEEVLWGKLDFLIVDLPPGTADAPLSVMQILPITGVVIVFTPQSLTAMIVKKAVKMAQQMQKPVIGLVENMSYLYIPELKKKMELFGKSHSHEMEIASGAPLLAQLPIDPDLVQLCDTGNIESYNSAEVDKLGESIIKTAK